MRSSARAWMVGAAVIILFMLGLRAFPEGTRLLQISIVAVLVVASAVTAWFAPRHKILLGASHALLYNGVAALVNVTAMATNPAYTVDLSAALILFAHDLLVSLPFAIVITLAGSLVGWLAARSARRRRPASRTSSL